MTYISSIILYSIYIIMTFCALGTIHNGISNLLYYIRLYPGLIRFVLRIQQMYSVKSLQIFPGRQVGARSVQQQQQLHEYQQHVHSKVGLQHHPCFARRLYVSAHPSAETRHR